MAPNTKVEYLCHGDQKTFERVQRDLGEDEQTRRQLVQSFRQWISEQPHLNGRSDEHCLSIYIRGCKYDLDKAKTKYENNLKFRTSLPDIFTGWDPLKPELQAALSAGILLPLPGYDEQFRKVVISRTREACNASSVKRLDLEKANLMISNVSSLHHEKYCCHRIVMIYDFKGFSFSSLDAESIWILRTMTRFYQEAYPIQPKLIIFFNTSRIGSYFFGFVKALLKEKIKERIHDVGSDLGMLHKLVSRKILPKDYGGEGKSLDKITMDWKKRVEDQREFLMEQGNYKYDESKRPAGQKAKWFGFN